MTPRAQAKAEGRKYYKGGKPCRHHGTVIRQTNNGTCVECQRIGHKQYMVNSGIQEYPSAYHEGRNYRAKNRPKRPPYRSFSQEFFWWLAGWNDRDIELAER